MMDYMHLAVQTRSIVADTISSDGTFWHFLLINTMQAGCDNVFAYRSTLACGKPHKNYSTPSHPYLKGKKKTVTL